MKKSIFLLIMMFVLAFTINAQNDTMYIIKQGNILGKYKVSDVDSVIFYKPSTTVTDIDGNVYHTVTIGTQVWMVENLKVTKYNDGTSIPNVTDNTQWKGLTTGAYCWYNNNVNNKNTYGALYNWYVVNSNKLAPAGWHIPTDAEWTTLTNYLGGENIAGGKLKEAGTAHWLNPNTDATNESGFTALPGGARYVDGTFVNLGSNGGWWSSTTNDTQTVWIRDIYRAEGKVSRGYAYNQWGYSVRCILGTLTLPSVTTTTISNKTATSASSGGNITSDGGTPVTARGVCWSTSPNPTTANSKTTDGTGTGSFTSNITGLTANTTYYVRSYAINSQGTAYGAQESFTTTRATVYMADVKPIMTSSCTPCHVAGGANPNKWDEYTPTKTKIASIIDRVKREQGSAGFMPRNGTKLSADKIAILEKWVADGLLEK